VLSLAAVVSSIVPRDLNIVVDRLPLASDERFDLVVATNVLFYYDVFAGFRTCGA